MNSDEKRLLNNKDPIVEELYARLIEHLKEKNAQFKAEYKKDSIHLVAKSAFLGIHFMKNCMRLTVVSDKELHSPRIFKIEKTSASRFYVDIKIFSPDELDAELFELIKQSYKLRS